MAATEKVWDGSAKARTDLASPWKCRSFPSTNGPPATFSTSTTFATPSPPRTWPILFRLMLRGLEGGQDAQSRTLLRSLTGPTEDQITTLKLAWPPDFGGSIPRNESDVNGLRTGSKYPTNQALASCDSSQTEELLSLGSAANADREGEALTEWTKLRPSCSTGGSLKPSARSKSCHRHLTTW
eukprot:9466340-Pyramimonas_sp.AAC.1